MIIRTMQNSDIAEGLRLCRAAHWNQLQRDWELFLQLSPHGCRVACIDEKIVGTVTIVRYQQKFSWIGMVLVDPAQRRQGIGTQLLHSAVDILRDETTVKLDATPAGREVYLKLNFVDEYRLSRMETIVSGIKFSTSDVRPLLLTDLPAVLKMDQKIFGAARNILLQWTLAGAPELAWVLTSANKIKGYCLGRHGYNFLHLGPIIAEDSETAQQLVSACLQGQIGKSVILDTPHHHTGFMQWLNAIGFREQRPFIRMFRGSNNFPGNPAYQFAILGPEFG